MLRLIQLVHDFVRTALNSKHILAAAGFAHDRVAAEEMKFLGAVAVLKLL